MQDQEPPPGTLPGSRHIMPLAAVNWIAFRHAADRDLSGQADGMLRWEVRDVGNGYSPEVLAALREAAGGPAMWTPPDGAADGTGSRRRVPGWALHCRTLARLLMQERGGTAADLADLLAGELDGAAQRQDAIEDSRLDLLEALAAGEVDAVACDPVGQNEPTSRRFQLVPRLLFKTRKLLFHPDGYVTERGHPAPVLREMELDRSQVQRRWPAPCAQAGRTIAAVDLQQAYARFVSGHVKVGTQPTVPETRQAMVAAFPGHKPPTERMINALRASPITPEAWREPGRHRKQKS